MRLFTKDIDKQLFAQYPLGGDLSKQKVVAKIFNPFGNGTWYIINSDKNDPDYLWAIVDLFEVEVGSVSRMDLETIKVPPFRLGLERDMSFTPINAQELFDGLLQGKHYARGGMMDANAQNKAMLLNQAEGFEHHAEEFESAVKKADEIPAWVVAKSQRASTDLSDITHYLDGENEQKREMEEGEEYARGGVTNEFGVESTEKMKELISEERNKKIKEWYGLGQRVVVGRNDGYNYETSDGESESIVASNPSTKKVIEIIKNNPNVVEIGFNGTIKTGERVGQELEIADDFYVVLWHKDDKYFKEGTTFEFVDDNGKYINKIVNKKDTITYKDRDDNRKYVYFTQLDKKHKTTSEARYKRDVFKGMVDENEIIIKNDSDYMARGGELSIKVGDKVKSKSGVSGVVYESTGTMFKLQDDYGNKSSKWHSTREFKKSDIKSMAQGGKIKDQYEGKNAQEIWDNLSKSQRQHFIYDHANEIENYRGEEYGELTSREIISAYNSDFSGLDKNIRNRFENHVRQGQYKSGGEVDKHRVYFSSFAEVMDAIHDIANENGYDVVDIFPDLSYGGVGYGQTKRAKVELEWNGKEKVGKSKKREKNTMNVQIYRMDSGNYELNSYFSYAYGGYMAKGGEIRYKLKGNNFGQQIESGQKFKALIQKVFENQSGEHKYPENFIKETAYTGKIVKNEGSNYLKDYSYKGTLTKFEFLDDKDFVEALKYLDRPSIKSFKFEDGGYMAKGGGIKKYPKNYKTKYNKGINPKYNYALLQLNKNGDIVLMGTYAKMETAESQKKFWEKNYAYPQEVDKFVIDELVESKMAMGGVTFDDKVKAVKSSLLKRKKVSPSVQKDYGKTYSPKEAEESAKRIVGSMTARERLKSKMAKKKKK